MKVNRHRKISVVSSSWNHVGYSGRLSTESPSSWRVFMKASPVLPGDASESQAGCTIQAAFNWERFHVQKCHAGIANFPVAERIKVFCKHLNALSSWNRAFAVGGFVDFQKKKEKKRKLFLATKNLSAKDKYVWVKHLE